MKTIFFHKGYAGWNSDSSDRIHERKKLQTQYSRRVNGNEISRHEPWITRLQLFTPLILTHYEIILNVLYKKKAMSLLWYTSTNTLWNIWPIHVNSDLQNTMDLTNQLFVQNNIYTIYAMIYRTQKLLKKYSHAEFFFSIFV